MKDTRAAFVERISELGYGERLLHQEPLRQYTSYGIGGPADLLMVAENTQEMQDWVATAKACGLAYCVLGGGTNILIADKGIRGLVIINACRVRKIDETGLLVADSGNDLSSLGRWTVDLGWDGLTWAVGVPGTLGGAVIGNAGAYGGCIADNLRWVKLLTEANQQDTWDAAALDYGYRYSALKEMRWGTGRPVVLQAALQLVPGEIETLRETAQANNTRRRERTPQGACAGSVFKRTLQYPAGYLIEQAGLKGTRVGAAEVSPKHANFVMNTGGATAAEVRMLIEQVQRAVFERFGLQLEREIEFLGDW